MASPIGSVYVNLGVNSAEFKTGMKSAAASAKVFGKEVQTATRMAQANARNLSFQLVDMAQTIPLALQSPIHGLQGLGFQMAQIGQIYAGQGGMRAALRDSIGQVTSFARAAGPAILAAGAIAAAFAGMAHEINSTSDVAVSFGDTALATFQVLRDWLYEEMRPAVDAIAPWFAAAWEAVVADVKLSGNQIINAVRVAIEGVKAAVSAVPGMFKSAWNGAAAAVYSALQSIVLGVDKALASAAQGLNEMFGTRFQPPSALLDAWGELNVLRGNAEAAAKAGAAEADAVWDGFRERAAEIAASDPMGEIFGRISAQAQANARARLAGEDKPGGGGRGGRPETDRAAEKAAREAERQQQAYERMIAFGREFVAAQQIEARALGMTEEAANRLRYEFDFLADAQRQGIELTPQQTARLSELAGQMARTEAQTTALEESLNFTRDTAGSFFSDLAHGLRNGEGLWRSFADAATSALDRITDKLLNDVLDAIFQVNNAGGGGGFLGKIFGSLFGGGLSIGSNVSGLFSGGAFSTPSFAGPSLSGLPSIRFASGGVVNGPTVFPMASGMGLMGEAGPEAIMPLRRGPGGRLGVEASGGGRSEVVLYLSRDVEGRILQQAEGQSVRIARREARGAVGGLMEAQREYPVIR